MYAVVSLSSFKLQINAIYWPKDKFLKHFHLFALLKGFPLEFTDHCRDDGLLFEQRKSLTDTLRREESNKLKCQMTIRMTRRFNLTIAWTGSERYISIAVPPLDVFWQKSIGIKLFRVLEESESGRSGKCKWHTWVRRGEEIKARVSAFLWMNCVYWNYLSSRWIK